jgi:hypothetical protein
VVDAADTDVVQGSVVAQGDGSGLVDAVGADPVVGVDAGGGVCFGPCGVDGGGGGAVGQRAVWRRWLYSSTKAVSWICSSARVVARGWLVSDFFIVWWNLSLFRRWWGDSGWS